MTYASIEEAWPSNALTIPMEKKRHPLHPKQQQQQRQQPQRQGQQQRHGQQQQQQQRYAPKTENDPYKCEYAGHNCLESIAMNTKFNNEQKRIAAGMQPFLPSSPGPHNYTFLPQYPWSEHARNGYLMYGPGASSMWYNDPFGYRPDVANQILQKQLHGTVGPLTPIGAYRPQGFVPGNFMNPPEHFTNDAMNSDTLVYIALALAVLSILIGLATMTMVYRKK